MGAKLTISTSIIKELREKTGVGIMDCKAALLECDGDISKAIDYLRKKGIATAKKRGARTTSQGQVQSYIHAGGKIGVLVEVNCETDFVAHTDEFKELAHCLAMQVAAQSPQFISSEEVPEGTAIEPQTACLLLQPYIKDTDKTVQDIITETITKVGENIKVSRFARFELSEGR